MHVRRKPYAIGFAALALCASSMGTFAAKNRSDTKENTTAHEGYDRLEVVSVGIESFQKVDVHDSQMLALSVKVFVEEDILFPLNRAELNATTKSELSRLAAELLKFPTANVACTGHTDSNGSDEYNLALGLKRAKAVKDYLVNRGVQAERISVVSLGEAQPCRPNDTSAYRSLNRRVSLEFAWNVESTKQARRMPSNRWDEPSTATQVMTEPIL